jgi:hypothetical protein
MWFRTVRLDSAGRAGVFMSCLEMMFIKRSYRSSLDTQWRIVFRRIALRRACIFKLTEDAWKLTILS